MGDPADPRQDVVVAVQEAVVDEIVILQPGEGAGIVGGAFPGRPVGLERGQRILPRRPGPGIAGLDDQVAREQPAVIGGDQVAALVLGDRRHEAVPDIGPEQAGAAAIEPVEFGPGHQEHPAQRQVGRPVGMRLGIDQRQRRAPRAAEHDPAADPQGGADRLHVRDQIPGGVGGDAGMGPRPAAAALVEQHHPIGRRVEVPPHRRAAAAPRPAMDHDHRDPVRVAALFHIDPVPAADVQHALIEGVDRCVQNLRRGFLACELFHGRTI